MVKFLRSALALSGLLLLTVLTGCDSVNQVPDTAKLERVDIIATPVRTRGVSQLTLAAGNEQAFEALGHYSDGSSRTLTDLNVSDWHSTDEEVGFFDKPGVLTGKASGFVTVSLIKNGIASNTVNVDVTNAVITEIAVTPSPVLVAKGQTQQLVATATYSDNTSSDVSSSVTWIPVDTGTAAVTPAGLLSGVEEGMTSVTATKDGITSNTVNVDVTSAVITAIAITPSPVSVAKGQTHQLVATATYSDKTSADVSSSVTWTPVDTGTAAVTSAGLLSGVQVGTTAVTANKDGIISNPVNVEVTSAVITTISVTPSPVSVAKGQTQQLVATATYSDNSSSDVSSSVTWIPVDTAIATVTPAGSLSGVKVGTTAVTAAKGGITSNTVNVEVTSAVITAIAVTPSPVSVAKGQTQQLVATATYSDSTSSDVSSSVTWTPVDTGVAVVTPAGLLSGVKVGNTTVSATKDGITSNAVSVDVSSAVITAIAVTPSLVSVAKGQTQQLLAIATYSDNTSSDVSSSVTWTPVDTGTAAVTPAGLLSGVEEGTTSVTATKDGITSNTVDVEVTSAVITAIVVTPSRGVSVLKGQTQQLVATATYSDGAASDVSSSVTWTPGDIGIATVTPAGLLSGVEEGTTSVTAIKDSIISNTVNVDVSVVVGIQVYRGDYGDGILIGKTLEAWCATVTYSYRNSRQVCSSDTDSPDSLTWTIADTAIATMTPDGGILGVALGTTAIAASKDGINSGPADFSVVRDLSGAVIDVFDHHGTLYTSSPSVAYLDSIGGAPNDGSIVIESSEEKGEFYLFSWDNANSLCATYNSNALAGRTDWRLPEIDELAFMQDRYYGSMFATAGWPVQYFYWTSDPGGAGYRALRLGSWWFNTEAAPDSPLYVSCASGTPVFP